MNIYDVLKRERTKNAKLKKLCCRILEFSFLNNEKIPNEIYLKDIDNVAEEDVIALFSAIGYKVLEIDCFFKEKYGFCVSAQIKKNTRK